MMQLETQVKETIAGLQPNYLALANGIQKWSKFLCRAVQRVSRITGTPPEDVLGDILVGLIKVNELHQRTLWRYDGNLWKLTTFDGYAVLLETLEYNTRMHRKLWVDSRNVERVKKGKLESSIYREIYQQYVDMLTAHFTAKRGFVKESTDVKTVIVRSGPREISLEKRAVKNVKKTAHLVDIDIPSNLEETELNRAFYPSLSEVSEYLSDRKNDPEQTLVSEELVTDLGTSLSSDAQVVFGLLMNDTNITNRAISSVTGMSRRKIDTARFEIMNDYSQLAGISRSMDIYGRSPVYMRASQIC